MFQSINLSQLSTVQVQNILNHSVAPRPVCFASTIDAAGNVNLSPFSYFNVFSVNPPVVIFSPSRRVRNNTIKHSLENIFEVPEVVINIVSYEMIQQVSLSSCEYPKGIDGFIKSGFTKEPSIIVKPPRVKESPIQMECRVKEIKSLGDSGGAGNLVICEVLMMHIIENLLDDNGQIDQRKLSLVARLGGNWYARIDTSNLFEVEKPSVKLGIGLDQLPASIKNSPILTGNHLGQLANVHELPDIDPAFEDEMLTNIFQYYSLNPTEMQMELHRYAAKLLDAGKLTDAWQVLLALE